MNADVKHPAFALFALLLALGRPASAQTHYSVKDLGRVSGFNRFMGTGINATGQASVSSAQSGYTGHALFYNGANLLDLGTLGGSNNQSQARGINNQGWVVGWANNKANSIRPALWKNGGAGTDILGKNGQAIAINNASSPQITGTYSDAKGSHAFLWRNGGFQTLAFRQGNAINDLGQIAGSTQLSGNSYLTACFWSASTGVVNLPALAVGQATEALGINNVGVSVGEARDASGVPHAVSWQGGSIRDLGIPAGWGWTRASAINDNGVIVGGSGGSAGNPGVAWRWDATAGMVDLNTLIDPSLQIQFQWATGINANGQIVGYGTVPGDVWEHALVLTPQ